MTIDAAFATLGAVEFEGVIEANGHGFDVLEHFFSCHMRFLHNSVRHRRMYRCRNDDVNYFRCRW